MVGADQALLGGSSATTATPTIPTRRRSSRSSSACAATATTRAASRCSPRFFVRASDPLVEMHWGDGPPPPRALVYRIDGPEGKGAAWVQEWSRSDCVVSACTVKRVAADDVEAECAAAAENVFVYGAAVRMPGDKKPRNLPAEKGGGAGAGAAQKRARPRPTSSDSEDEQPLRRKPGDRAAAPRPPVPRPPPPPRPAPARQRRSSPARSGAPTRR